MAGRIELKPIKKAMMNFTIIGLSQIVHHNWDEKAKQTLRDKHAGKKTKNRAARDPAAEFEAAKYKTKDGKDGIHGMAFKKSLISAAHKDLGIEKTLVRKAIFLVTNDPNQVLPMKCKKPINYEKPVRVGQGQTDLRYRPMYKEGWEVEIELEIDGDLLKPDDVLALVDRAGFGVGIGEGRPEKDGEFGRYEVNRKKPIEASGF